MWFQMSYGAVGHPVQLEARGGFVVAIHCVAAKAANLAQASASISFPPLAQRIQSVKKTRQNLIHDRNKERRPTSRQRQAGRP